jgi:organic radical activating enzyme
MMMVLFYPTMRCQLKCEYCHFKTEARQIPYVWTGYGTDHVIERELTAKEALTFFSQFQPYHIEFSGGEPLLWPEFREFVERIPMGSQWAITSNTLEPVEDIDLTKCIGWTASYHVSAERFKKNLLTLQPKVGMAVSFVVRCDMEDIEKNIAIADQYVKLGFRPNFLREVNPGVSWEGTEEWERVKGLGKLGWNVPEDDIPDHWGFDSGFKCRGGKSYMAVMPGGDIFRCYSDAMDGKPIGKIGESFTPSPVLHECNRPCYSCALDFQAHVEKI